MHRSNVLEILEPDANLVDLAEIWYVRSRFFDYSSSPIFSSSPPFFSEHAFMNINSSINFFHSNLNICIYSLQYVKAFNLLRFMEFEESVVFFSNFMNRTRF